MCMLQLLCNSKIVIYDYALTTIKLNFFSHVIIMIVSFFLPCIINIVPETYEIYIEIEITAIIQTMYNFNLLHTVRTEERTYKSVPVCMCVPLVY